MQPVKSTYTARQSIEADLIQQVANEIEDTLILHAPDHWPDETCDEIERQVLDQTRTNMTAQTTSELQLPGTLRQHISTAVETTKRLCYLDRERS